MDLPKRAVMLIFPATGADAGSSGDMSAEVLILDSKRCPQSRLFITQDKQVKAKPDDDPVLKNREIAEEEPLADYYRHDGNVHRVSHVPV